MMDEGEDGQGPQDPLDRLLARKAQRSSQSGDPLDRLMARKNAPSQADSDALFREQGLLHDPQAIHREAKGGNLARRMATENQQDADLTAADSISPREAGGGTLANMLRYAPGGTAVTAGLHAAVHGQPYKESLATVEDVQSKIPAAVRIPVSVAGGAVAASAFPGSPAEQGGRYGVTEALLQPGPAPVSDRLRDAAVSGATGSVIGKLGEIGSTIVRGGVAPSRDALALRTKDAIREATGPQYAAAAAEGAGAVAPASLSTAFAQPDIKKYADVVRSMRQFQGADEATIARETFKRMSQREGSLLDKLKVDYEASAEQELESLRQAKDELRSAASQMMPSWEPANSQFSQMKKAEDAGDLSSRVMNRVVRDAPTPDSKLYGPENKGAFLRSIAKMTPEEAQQAQAMAVARAREAMGRTNNPFRVVSQANRTSPYLNALDSQSGAKLPNAIRSLLISAGTPEP